MYFDQVNIKIKVFEVCWVKVYRIDKIIIYML